MARKPKAVEPVKKDRGCLTIDERYTKEGDREKYKPKGEAGLAEWNDELVARALGQPEVRAARVIQRVEGDTLEINACAEELRAQVAEVNGGKLHRPEAMLVAQAHTLDALFSSLAMRSQSNSRGGYLEAADRYMRLALKAQAQAVRTIEALGELKNPRPVAFVKQANIANMQQVNNGPSSQAGIFENQQSKLSAGEIYELPENSRTPSLESATYSPVEALGEIDRAKVRAG